MKLGKQMYFTATGEKKINCYKINIPKVVVKKSEISDEDEIKVYAKDNKIIIEREKKNECRRDV